MSNSSLSTANANYSEYLEYSDKINELSNDMTKYIVLANDRITNSLLGDTSGINTYIESIQKVHKEQDQFIHRMVSLGLNAFDGINKSISSINQLIEQNNSENASNHDYTQQLISSLQQQIEEQNNTISSLQQTISHLLELIKPPKITRDHVENAKYLIENVKNNQGKTIKGASITIQNVQAILEHYDRLKQFNASEPSTATPTKSSKRK